MRRGKRLEVPGPSTQKWRYGESVRGAAGAIEYYRVDIHDRCKGMHIRNEQLAELLSLTAHNLSQLSEALTTFSLELMASEDPAVRIASRRMVSRVSAIQAVFDQKSSVLLATPSGPLAPHAIADSAPNDGAESTAEQPPPPER